MPTGVYIRRIPESEETRAKKSLAMKGNTHTKGHVLTEEHKAKISVANKIACKGQRNKLDWHTPQETRIKLSEVHKGKKQSEEHRRNNSLAQTGRVKSVKERMKLSFLLILSWCYNRLKSIVRWIIMKAQYWTAIGAMAFPLGVTLIILAILLVDRDTENYWVTGLTITGYVSIIVGFVCIIAGWAYTIKEGKEEKKQRQVEAKERQRELQLHLIVLTQISQDEK